MPFEPFRFVHAANLCLDATLQCTMALPEDAQSVVEDATLTAFASLIHACVEQNADFLLLTGNSFVERDRSLRARLALRDGFNELSSHGIPVFVTPGEQDPPEAWEAIPELPDNVTVCYPSNPEPTAVMREGRVVATIANTLLYGAADHFGIKASPSTGDRRPYRIGMLHPSRLAELEGPEELADQPIDDAPAAESSREQVLATFLRQSLVDYAVLASQVNRRTIRLKSGLAHCPGRTQPLAAADHGTHGATLVAVDESGDAQTTRLATVAARWKSFDVQAPPGAEAADLVRLCRETLDAEPREDTESVWLINWNLLVPQSLAEELTVPGAVDRFTIAIVESAEAQEPRYVHSLRAFPVVADAGDDENPLATRFRHLTQDLRIDAEALQQAIPASARQLGWNDRMRALVSELDVDLIEAHVRRLGSHWFANVSAGSDPQSEHPPDDESAGVAEDTE